MIETNLNISIDDERLKNIAEAVTNKTCKKILDLLTTKELTTTDISKELKVPINTIDYNIKKLLNTGLIEKKSFWWSVKGKKMPTYTVSNKQIIISPKKISQNMRYFLAFGITGFLGTLIKFLTKPAKVIYTVTDQVNDKVFSEAVTFSRDAVGSALPKVAEQTTQTITYFPKFGFAEWFLLGAWLTIILFFLIHKINERRKK